MADDSLEAGRFIERAAGFEAAYGWQVRLAVEGLPEVLEVPTGCGKTAGVVLAWLYRRRFHPDPVVRAATPRRLVFTLPLRTLVGQTAAAVTGWLTTLGLTDAEGSGEVLVRTLLGGERGDDAWRVGLDRDTILIGTLDMVLSRCLNRGYGSSRYLWPVDFGLLNNDVHFVFDEVQLMGAAVPTSRQLDAFRRMYGAYGGCGSTWMSATLDRARLATVDAPEVPAPVGLDPSDVTDELRRRLGATRRFGRWLREASDERGVVGARAREIVAAHQAGTLTLAVLNTVDAARTLHAAVHQLAGDVPVCLLHSRFRPPDRAQVLGEVLSDPGPAGRIVISTQVVEAGVDLSAAALFIEAAPWSSIVQRAGRCNRDGRRPDAQVRWDRPARDAPYPGGDIDAAVEQLGALDGRTLTTSDLAGLYVEERGGDEPMGLRRADLVRLFDTTPDLAGNDLDVSPFIRDSDELDVQICWRDLSRIGVDEQPSPHRDELCPVPIGELRSWLARRRSGPARVMRLDHVDRRDHRWLPADATSLRPGLVLLADIGMGGYRSETGWDSSSGVPVVEHVQVIPSDPAPVDEQVGDDPGSHRSRWVTLDRHLRDVADEVSTVLDALGFCDAMPAEIAAAVMTAARWHDLGKAHEVFQDTMARTRLPTDDEPGPGPWAKSGGSGQARHQRRYFRHELASALALLGDAGAALGDIAERDLAVYLVAAHHGRVRLAIRSFPDESLPPAGADGSARRAALGVWDGDVLPTLVANGVKVPASRLDLAPMDLGGAVGPSWVARAARLRDRPDLGVFRLAYLETIVRMADWRASAAEQQGEL